MFKTTAKTLLFALGMSTLGTGCDVQDLIDFLRLIDPPTPPIEDCDAQLDQCLASGLEPDACFVEYDACNGVEPPPPPVDCEEQLDQCLNGGAVDFEDGDAAMPYPGDDDCWFQYEQCIDDEPQPPPPPVDFCEEQLQECLDNPVGDPNDPVFMPYPVEDDCWIQYEECLGVEPPPPPPIDPCEEELEICLQEADATGIDPDACFTAFDECIGIEPPPVDICEQQLEDCLNQPVPMTDDGTTDMIYPYPGEDVCWIQYEECLNGEPPPPPVDPCEEELDVCLEQFVAPDGVLLPGHEVCFERFDQCHGWDEPCELPEPMP